MKHPNHLDKLPYDFAKRLPMKIKYWSAEKQPIDLDKLSYDLARRLPMKIKYWVVIDGLARFSHEKPGQVVSEITGFQLLSLYSKNEEQV